MQILTTRPFEEDNAALPKPMRTLVLRKLKLFLQNPRHPSLRVKKMADPRDIWEGGITERYRLTFHWRGDTVVFRRIGTHDILKTP